MLILLIVILIIYYCVIRREQREMEQSDLEWKKYAKWRWTKILEYARQKGDTDRADYAQDVLNFLEKEDLDNGSNHD